MIRYTLSKMLAAMQRRYDYNVDYMQRILETDLSAFLKFMGFQTMSSHAGNLPPEVQFAAKLRAIIWDDCGPCTQLVTDMALESQVDPRVVRAIIDKDLQSLPAHVADVVEFTDLVLAHDPAADELRQRLLSAWGDQGLIAIGFGISTCRVYPALKYAMGYGKACSRIRINEDSLVPNRHDALALEG